MLTNTWCLYALLIIPKTELMDVYTLVNLLYYNISNST